MWRLRRSFPLVLAERCGLTETALPVHAFELYMAELTRMVSAWRSSATTPARIDTAEWCSQHTEIFHQVKLAVALRTTMLRVSGASGSDEASTSDLAIRPLQRFILQVPLNAPEIAARAVFGDFLLNYSKSTGFCRRCSRPFQIGQKKLNCGRACANLVSAKMSRQARQVIYRRKALREASRVLGALLTAPHGPALDWRSVVEAKVKAFRTSTGRKSRALGRYIEAARTAEDSVLREDVLHSLLPSSDTACSTKDANLLRRQLGRFFDDIQKVTSACAAKESR
jgi:hypothetical protein